MFSPKKTVRTLSIIPMFVILTMILVASSVFYWIIVPYIWSNSYNTLFITVDCILITIFSICFILSLISYFKCIFTNPGRVDKKTITELESRLLPKSVIRDCYFCHIPKYPRIHHCSICGMCVTNMDHHCIWLCNCIGHYNKKYFILFMGYIFIAALILIYNGILMIIDYIHSAMSLSPLLCIVVTMCTSFAVSLFFFGGFHLYLILCNKTTIELRFSFTELFQPSIYTKGSCYDNFVFIFGKNPWLWFLPVNTTLPFNWNNNNDIDSQSILPEKNKNIQNSTMNNNWVLVNTFRERNLNTNPFEKDEITPLL